MVQRTSSATRALRSLASPGAAAPSPAALDDAIGRLQDHFRSIQNVLGYWWGELESNNTMEAEYVMLSRFLGRRNPERERHIVNYLLHKQREDGSWPIYYGAPGDLSTSVECYFALKLCGQSRDAEPMRRARRFILERAAFPKRGCSPASGWRCSASGNGTARRVCPPK